MRAKVLKTKLPPEPIDLLPAWTMIASFQVDGVSVPWSVSRRGTKNPRLTAWQGLIKRAAFLAMDGRKPYAGPVRFTAHFAFARTNHPPDLTNLIKAAEDAIQGIVIVNDRQVKEHGKMKLIMGAPVVIADTSWIDVEAI